jgi:hypothetical protein
MTSICRRIRRIGRRGTTHAGIRLWAVRVMDPDPDARKGQAEVSVKIAAQVQPVPPMRCPVCRSGRWSSTA